MALTQQTFLGASIVSFNANLGWNGQSSSLNVTVVEDHTNGDNFQAPLPGQPSNFVYGDFTFNGLVSTWEKRADTSANPIYDITLVDPSEILDGTQLILSDYSGDIRNVPNLINIYGYLENQEFGMSGLNSSGIKWRIIREALRDILGGTQGDYGGLLRYRGYTYNFNVDTLPRLDDYRISGPSISLLELIQELEEASANDFFITLGGNVISTNSVSRKEEPAIGMINKFVTEVEGAVAKKVGYEARQGFTGKFLVGSNIERLYIQNKDVISEEELEDQDEDEKLERAREATIWPYWGKDHNGDLVLGVGEDDDHTIVLDSRHIDVAGIGATYKTSVAELRAAAESQSSWETFLILNNGNEFKITNRASKLIEIKKPIGEDPGVDVYRRWNIDKQVIEPIPSLAARLGTASVGINAPDWNFILSQGLTTIVKTTVQGGKVFPIGSARFRHYEHNGEENIFYLRAQRLGLIGSANDEYQSLVADEHIDYQEFVGFHPIIFSPFAKTQVRHASGDEYTNEDRKKEIYEFVSSYAQEYFGRKYMVRVPFVFVKSNEEETGEIDSIETSQEPIDAAFLDESLWDEARTLNLIPVDIDKFLTQEGKLQCYVRFDRISGIDLSLLSEEDYAVGLKFKVDTDGDGDNSDEDQLYDVSLFVKCDIDRELVFLDRDTGESPRAVITLPTRITERVDDIDRHAGAFEEFINDATQDKARQKNVSVPNAQELKKLANDLLKQPGGDVLNEPNVGLHVLPDVAGIPLRNKLDTYGPFVALGADSKVEFEQDDSLNPWTYGSFSLMNTAANAKVNDAVVLQTFGEYGSVEVPGVPTLNLGSALISRGPYITDIRVNVGSEVTTTYSMKTWNRRNRGVDLEKLRKFGKFTQLQRKKNRLALREPPPFGSKYYQKRRNALVKRNTSNSSHSVLIGNMKGEKINVFSEPTYNAVAHLNDYYNTAVVSWDALFSPVSTNPDYSGALPKLGTGSSQNFPNASDINPYPRHSGRLAQNIVSYGEDVPRDSFVSQNNFHFSGDYRAMALKGPLLLHGWGYDVDGNPVPGEDELDESGVPTGETIFASGYLSQPSTWPCGPVELRWDNQSKTWRTGTAVKHGLVKNGICAPSSFGQMTEFLFEEYEIQGSSVIMAGSGIGHNIDPALVVPSGSDIFIITQRISDKWIPIWVGCE